MIAFIAPNASTDPMAGIVTGLIFSAVAFALYFLPTIFAWNNRNRASVFVLNLFLGWTIVGWVVALCWGLMNDAPPVVVQQVPTLSAPLPSSPSLLCSGCGRYSATGSKFCSICGQSFDQRASSVRFVRAETASHDPEHSYVLDDDAENWIKQNPDIDKSFPAKVVGVSHENLNGTSRQEILRRCSPPETLRLVEEPDNPVDPRAIAVRRENGEQLGYLDSRLAGETRNRLNRGERWGARLMAITGGDGQHKTLGANILMFRFASVPSPKS